MSGRVAISAHRGGGEWHPQGTWEAYRSALQTGAEYVEFDVRRLGDRTMVCYHDERVQGGGPLLRDIGYAELRDRVGYQVPIVAELLDELAGGTIGHIDLKETGYESEVVKLAMATLGADGFVVTSLEDESIARVSREFPKVPAALSLGRDRRELGTAALIPTRLSELFPLRRLRACGARWVAVDKTLARAGVLRRCARHHIRTMVWTVDETPLIDHFLSDRRVEVLVTNRPQHAAARRGLRA